MYKEKNLLYIYIIKLCIKKRIYYIYIIDSRKESIMYKENWLICHNIILSEMISSNVWVKLYFCNLLPPP